MSLQSACGIDMSFRLLSSVVESNEQLAAEIVESSNSLSNVAETSKLIAESLTPLSELKNINQLGELKNLKSIQKAIKDGFKVSSEILVALEHLLSLIHI